MFGIKVKRIKIQNSYTVESLYETVKNQSFTAGTPMLVKHGLTPMVVFPALDSRNQVQIIAAGKNKFQIQKGEEAGLGNAAVNAVIDDLTGGLSMLKGIAGKNSKRCEELVEITTNELNALKL